MPTSSGPFDIRTDTSQEGSADTVLRLFDSSGNQLALNDNAGSATTASFIRANLVAGATYYVGVSGTGNSTYSAVSGSGTATGATGNYGLSIISASTPALTVSNPAAATPSVSGASITFTISLDYAATSVVTVDYTTADVSAIAGTDYTTTSGTLTFQPGETSMTVSVPILVDASSTGMKTFSLDLNNVSSNAVIDGGQGTGTITNLPVTNLPLTSKQPARYTDSNGRPVVIELSGPGTGIVTVVGSNASAVEVTLNGSTSKSHLTVVSSAKTATSLSSLQINGSLATLNAPHVELVGDLTVTGTIGLLILAGASGKDTLSIAGSNASGTLQLGNVSDLTVMSSEPLNTVTATQWTNLNSGDFIAAPSIKLLQTKGDFGAAVTVGSGTGVVLNNARIGGAITGGTWTINGSAGTIVAGTTAVAWDANISGGVTTLSVTGNASGNISAGSIRTLSVHGDFSSASLNLTSAGTLKNPDLNSMIVNGTFSNSVLRSAGDIKSVHLGALASSSIFAGVNSAVTSMPTSAADFVSQAEIVSFAVTGVRGGTYAVQNSTVAAAKLDKVVVAKVNGSNGGLPFGFSTESLSSFTDSQPHNVIHLSARQISTGTLTVAGDFQVSLLAG